VVCRINHSIFLLYCYLLFIYNNRRIVLFIFIILNISTLKKDKIIVQALKEMKSNLKSKLILQVFKIFIKNYIITNPSSPKKIINNKF